MVAVGITARVLAIMESFSAYADEGLTPQTIIQRSGLPPSTVYRLLMEFEEAGLLYRTADRRIHPNFSFERRLSFEHISPARLVSACTRISDALESAAEIIVLRGQNLLWQVVQQHPAQAIRLRAHAGFVRATYELDSITRLALASCPSARIERTWDTTAFFDAGVARARVAWDSVRRTLESVDRDGVQFDLEGNAKGVRRFCVAVRDGERFACLLTVAEAATPLHDQAAHIARVRQVLVEQRDAVEAAGPAAPGAISEAGAPGAIREAGAPGAIREAGAA